MTLALLVDDGRVGHKECGQISALLDDLKKVSASKGALVDHFEIEECLVRFR